MSIERGVRSMIQRPYSEGYRVPGTRGINVEQAKIDLKKRKSFCNPIFYGHDEDVIGVPREINLTVYIEPEYIKDKGPLVNYVFDEYAFKACHLYDQESKTALDSIHGVRTYTMGQAIKTLNLYYSGEGEVADKKWSGPLKFNNGAIESFLIRPLEDFEEEQNEDVEDKWCKLFYKKEFLCPSSSEMTVSVIQKNGVNIVDPPGLEDGYPIWPYGGTYEEGDSLESIEQLFFTPKSIMDIASSTKAENADLKEDKESTLSAGRTIIHLLKASFLKSQKITPSKLDLKTSPYVFIEKPEPVHFYSLKDDVQQGRIGFELVLGDEEMEEDFVDNPSWQYVAYEAYHQIDNQWVFKFKQVDY